MASPAPTSLDKLSASALKRLTRAIRPSDNPKSSVFVVMTIGAAPHRVAGVAAKLADAQAIHSAVDAKSRKAHAIIGPISGATDPGDEEYSTDFHTFDCNTVPFIDAKAGPNKKRKDIKAIILTYDFVTGPSLKQSFPNSVDALILTAPARAIWDKGNQ